MTDGTPVIDGSGHAAPFWRSRWGWIAAHLLCGIAAAAIGFGVLLAVSFASGTGLALGLMTLAALIGLVPLVTYQSRTLRNAVAPWAWVLAWVAAVLPASWIVAVVLRAIVLHWGNDTVFAAWIAGAALAGLWGALVQWPALRRKSGFARWMAGGAAG